MKDQSVQEELQMTAHRALVQNLVRAQPRKSAKKGSLGHWSLVRPDDLRIVFCPCPENWSPTICRGLSIPPSGYREPPLPFLQSLSMGRLHILSLRKYLGRAVVRNVCQPCNLRPILKVLDVSLLMNPVWNKVQEDMMDRTLRPRL